MITFAGLFRLAKKVNNAIHTFKNRLKLLAVSLLAMSLLATGRADELVKARPYPDTLPRITELHLEGGNYTKLDVSKCDTILSVTCSNNKLDTLSVAGCTTLTILDCALNRLKSLDISDNIHLQRLNCTDNALSELNVTANPELVDLRCSGNHIKDLDVSDHIHLEHVGADMLSMHTFKAVNCTRLESILVGDSVKELDMTRCVALKDAPLYRLMEDVKLDSCLSLRVLERASGKLNLQRLTARWAALEDIDVSNSKLETIDLFNNNALSKLNCSRSLVRQLDLTTCHSLREVSADSAKLETLNISGLTRLEVLRCRNNDLNRLNISSCDAMKELYADHNRLQSVRRSNNALQTLHMFGNNLRFSQIYPFLQQRTGGVYRLSPQTDTVALETNVTFDLLSEVLIGGQYTTWQLTTATDNEVSANAYKGENGVFRFLKPGDYKLKMTNPAMLSFDNGTEGTPVEFTWYIEVTGKDMSANEDVNRLYVYVADKVICLSEPMGVVQVFNTAGKSLYKGTGTKIPVQTSGLYIVRTPFKTFKISVK